MIIVHQIVLIIFTIKIIEIACYLMHWVVLESGKILEMNEAIYTAYNKCGWLKAVSNFVNVII